VQRVYELFQRHEETLANRVLDYLRSKPQVRIHGQKAARGDRAPTISFTVEGRNSRELAEALNREKIAIGYGDFYARRCIEALGLAGQEGVVRIGLAHYNSMAEVERTIAAIDRLL
jgi:selenocysteine lyase/cysteine desulfurase